MHGDQVVMACGVTPVGEVNLVPDVTPFNTEQYSPRNCVKKDLIALLISAGIYVLPYYPSHALIFCKFIKRHTQPPEPWEYCPRTFLTKQILRLEKEFGYTTQVGFEHEFVLGKLEEDGGFAPLDETSYCSTNAMTSKSSEFLDNVIEALQQQGMKIVQFHPESAPGQFEIVVAHCSPLLAADQVFLARETLKHMAEQRGWIVSFLPKPFSDQGNHHFYQATILTLHVSWIC